jgi:hypothetical protein
MKILTEAKKAGQFRAFWKDFNESVNLMASGETVIQSMWSPAVTGALEGHRLHVPAAQGRLSLLGGGLLRAEGGFKGRSSTGPMNSSTGTCRAGPAPISTARAIIPPCSTAKANMTADEWGYWMEGKAAVGDIKAPDGTCWRRPAPSATAAPMRTAWAASPAGTPSWTRTTTWSASGTNSSPLDTLLIGFTVAYFLAFHVRSKTWQIVLSLLCTIPFWTSNVIRMIAWIPLLGRNGLVNKGLQGAG